jgi:3-methyl-2-oxobutanoate hydroxymethyltransferase
MHERVEKIAMLTCYDATFARILDESGVDVLLVGDSLGMVLQGHDTTLPVSIEHMQYHVSAVARGCAHAWIIADMPFGSYQESTDQAIRNASLLMKSGANMVKIEGGSWTAPIVRALSERGIPVCAHLGFTPQSVHALGGYRVQGRDAPSADRISQDAQALVDAGAAMLVVELIPSAVAEKLTRNLKIPVIGIGAGSACSGQVLVLHDMLGLTPGKLPRFVRNFTAGGLSVQDAIRLYVSEVKAGRFPNDTVHGY